MTAAVWKFPCGPCRLLSSTDGGPVAPAPFSAPPRGDRSALHLSGVLWGFCSQSIGPRFPGGERYPPRVVAEACPAPLLRLLRLSPQPSDRGFPFGPSLSGGQRLGFGRVEQLGRRGLRWGPAPREAILIAVPVLGLDSDYVSRPTVGQDDPSPACPGLPSEPTLRYPSRTLLSSQARNPPPRPLARVPPILRAPLPVPGHPFAPGGAGVSRPGPGDPLGRPAPSPLALAVSTPGSAAQ